MLKVMIEKEETNVLAYLVILMGLTWVFWFDRFLFLEFLCGFWISF